MTSEEIAELTRKLEAGELDEQLDEYIKSPEGQFYSQPHFDQWKLTEKGVVFIKNDSTFIPFEKFKIS